MCVRDGPLQTCLLRRGLCQAIGTDLHPFFVGIFRAGAVQCQHYFLKFKLLPPLLIYHQNFRQIDFGFVLKKLELFSKTVAHSNPSSTRRAKREEKNTDNSACLTIRFCVDASLFKMFLNF